MTNSSNSIHCPACGVVIDPSSEPVCTCGLRGGPMLFHADYDHLYSSDAYHVDAQIALSHPDYYARYDHDREVAEVRWRRHVGFTKRDYYRRALDVGCANGAFVVEASKHCDLAVGFDKNSGICAFAQAQQRPNGLVLCSDGLPSFLPATFDLITLHDCLEHVVDPYQMLRTLHGLCSHDGHIVVDVPDAIGLDRDGKDWKHWRPEQHVWHFTEDALVQAMIRSGFKIFKIDRPIEDKLVVYADAGGFSYFIVHDNWDRVKCVGRRQGLPLKYEDAVTWFCSIMRYSGMQDGQVQMWEATSTLDMARPVGWGGCESMVTLEDDYTNKLREAYLSVFPQDG